MELRKRYVERKNRWKNTNREINSLMKRLIITAKLDITYLQWRLCRPRVVHCLMSNVPPLSSIPTILYIYFCSLYVTLYRIHPSNPWSSPGLFPFDISLYHTLHWVLFSSHDTPIPTKSFHQQLLQFKFRYFSVFLHSPQLIFFNRSFSFASSIHFVFSLHFFIKRIK